MLRAIYSLSIVAMLLCSFLYPRLADAQAAKTIFATVSGQVLDFDGKPISSATVQLDGPEHAKTAVDTSGHFIFANVPPGMYTITVDAGGFDSLTRNNIAVQNEDVSLNISLSPKSNLKEIGHVSASSGRDSINVTAAPSYNLSPDDMAVQGQTQWRKILEEVPGVSVTSVDGGVQQTIPGSPTNDQLVSIRGALPYETAMLIDNMPMYGTGLGLGGGGGVDLAPYDPQAFSAFDVVQGPGADSPSIVDSIGGSLNLHPSGQVTENRYNFSLGDDPYGGWIANGLVAVRIGKLSATATYGFNNSPGPLQGSPQLLGIRFGGSINTINGTPFTCTGSCATTNIFPSGANAWNQTAVTAGIIGCCVPYADSSWIDHSGSLSLFYQLSPAVTAQFFFAGSNHPAGYADYALPTIFTPPSDYAGSLPAGSTTSQLFYSWRNATLAGNSQIYEGKVTYHLGNGQLQVAALSNTSGYSVNQNYPTGPLTLQLFGGGLYCLTPPCSATPGTPPGTSAFTPVTFNGSMQTVMLLQNTLDQSEIVHNRDLSVNYASAFSDRVRATISFVHSYYDDMSPTNCLQLFQNGNGTVGSFSYVSQPQSNFEATDQFRVGLGANPSDRVSVDLSSYFANARYHVVNPADATENTYIDEYYHYAAPRLSFVWRPNHNWAVRASTGGGFALAPLSDLDSGNYGIFCSSVCSQYVANTNLQPETSWGYDVGFDTRFAGSTILSFDAYSTNLKGQVYNNTAPAGTHLGVPLFTIQYRNLGQSRYEGIQLDLHHDVPKGMIWSISGSLMRGYIVSLPAGFYNGATCTNCANGLVVPGINFNGLFTNANIPYAQGFALWGYNWSPDRFVNLEVHYFGNNNGYYAPAFVAFDANLQVPLTRNVAMQGTFHNITGILDNAVTNGGQGIIYPAVNGPNAFEFSVPYGPRTFLLTLRIHS